MEAQFRNVPDGLWEQIAPIIPARRKNTLRGRPPVPDRAVLAGIVYRLRTGCQWKALPNEFGSGSTCHRRFKEWCAAGVFTKVFSKLLKFYDRRRGIQWKWSSLDSAMVKAPKGGDLTGPNRTDRAKSGVKRHILTDGRGVPLAAEITGANVHDKWLVGQMLDAVVLRAPRGPRRPEHLCLDKGYDYTDAEAAVRARRISPHISRIGERPLLGCVQGKPRRWVVERTNAWHNRFRGLLVRWERIGAHYRGLLHLACWSVSQVAVKSGDPILAKDTPNWQPHWFAPPSSLVLLRSSRHALPISDTGANTVSGSHGLSTDGGTFPRAAAAGGPAATTFQAGDSWLGGIGPLPGR